jgi:hypothetical protein
MEHRPIAELKAVAEINFTESPKIMPREQRLRRWIGLLEGHPDRKFRSLHEIEHLPRPQQRECRADNSPLSLAYDDAVLRSAGLRSDRVGDCTDFFELTDRQMHHAFCSCHVGISLTGMQAAQRLHRLLRSENLRHSLKRAMSRGFSSLIPTR